MIDRIDKMGIDIPPSRGTKPAASTAVAPARFPSEMYRARHDAYLSAIHPEVNAVRPLRGAARDQALLPLSCISLLAFDNHGYSYPVLVDDQDVLYFVGAPSGWRLADITTYPGGVLADQIALDMGQNWYCINFDQVLIELATKGYITL